MNIYCMRKRWEPAGSAAGSHLASEVGGRLPGSKNRTGHLRGQTLVLLCPGTLRRLVVRRPALHSPASAHFEGATPTRPPRLTIWYGWCRSDGSPFSSARLTCARCSRSGSGSRSLSRLLVWARVRPWVRSRVRARGRGRLLRSLASASGQAERQAATRQDTPDSKEAWARSGAWPPRAQTGKARYLSALQ